MAKGEWVTGITVRYLPSIKSWQATLNVYRECRLGSPDINGGPHQALIPAVAEMLDEARGRGIPPNLDPPPVLRIHGDLDRCPADWKDQATHLLNLYGWGRPRSE